jgi:hypothetical protein
MGRFGTRFSRVRLTPEPPTPTHFRTVSGVGEPITDAATERP